MADAPETTAAPTGSPGAPDATPAIEIEGLWTIFGAGRSQVVVHENLSLTIPRGEIVSLVGGSGSGKTVLLRQMLGLAHPARGTVRVMGEPAAELGGRGASGRVGMLFQQGALFSAFSVLENIAFPLRELHTVDDALAFDAALVKLQMVGLKPADAGKAPSDLSGGMIKRVALARALIMDPPLLLLDEPTAGLDPISSDAFCKLLAELQQALGLTVIMVTHDLDTMMELSHRVVVLAEKRIVANGTPAEVAQVDNPFIRDYFLGVRGRRALTMPPSAAQVLADAAATQAREAAAPPDAVPPDDGAFTAAPASPPAHAAAAAAAPNA